MKLILLLALFYVVVRLFIIDIYREKYHYELDNQLSKDIQSRKIQDYTDLYKRHNEVVWKENRFVVQALLKFWVWNFNKFKE